MLNLLSSLRSFLTFHRPGLGLVQQRREVTTLFFRVGSACIRCGVRSSEGAACGRGSGPPAEIDGQSQAAIATTVGLLLSVLWGSLEAKARFWHSRLKSANLIEWVVPC